jgi:hypothetical protein
MGMKQILKEYEEDETFMLYAWIVKFICIIFIVSFVIGWVYCNFFSPLLNVWQQGLAGQAELKRAESNRQITICEALALKESSKSLAEAEIIRAEGVAEANKIIGDSLAGNEGYLRYLWIQGLQTNNMQVVYVPTEANLPILEANRMK